MGTAEKVKTKLFLLDQKKRLGKVAEQTFLEKL
jgi:hypothetical protein